MAKYYNCTQGPLPLSLANGQSVMVGRKSWIEIPTSAGVSASVLHAVKQGQLVLMREPPVAAAVPPVKASPVVPVAPKVAPVTPVKVVPAKYNKFKQIEATIASDMAALEAAVDGSTDSDNSYSTKKGA